MTSPEGLMIGFVIGALGTALGGFVAAHKAGKLEIKHGALVGLCSLILSFIEQSLQEESASLPEWFRFLSVRRDHSGGGVGWICGGGALKASAEASARVAEAGRGVEQNRLWPRSFSDALSRKTTPLFCSCNPTTSLPIFPRKSGKKDFFRRSFRASKSPRWRRIWER